MQEVESPGLVARAAQPEPAEMVRRPSIQRASGLWKVTDTNDRAIVEHVALQHYSNGMVLGGSLEASSDNFAILGTVSGSSLRLLQIYSDGDRTEWNASLSGPAFRGTWHNSDGDVTACVGSLVRPLEAGEGAPPLSILSAERELRARNFDLRSEQLAWLASLQARALPRNIATTPEAHEGGLGGGDGGAAMLELQVRSHLVRLAPSPSSAADALLRSAGGRVAQARSSGVETNTVAVRGHSLGSFHMDQGERVRWCVDVDPERPLGADKASMDLQIWFQPAAEADAQAVLEVWASCSPPRSSAVHP
jgi:hypothetical protein